MRVPPPFQRMVRHRRRCLLPSSSQCRVGQHQDSDSDCEAFAADDGPSTIGSTRQHAGSVLPKPPQTTLGDHPSGCDSQTRRVKPTSPRPPLDGRTCLPAGRPRVRNTATLLLTLTGYHRENAPPDPEGSGSHLPPMTRVPPRPSPCGRRPGETLTGRLGLLGWTSLAGGGSPGTRMVPFTEVAPGCPDDAKPPTDPHGSPRMDRRTPATYPTSSPLRASLLAPATGWRPDLSGIHRPGTGGT